MKVNLPYEGYAQVMQASPDPTMSAILSLAFQVVNPENIHPAGRKMATNRGTPAATGAKTA